MDSIFRKEFVKEKANQLGLPVGISDIPMKLYTLSLLLIFTILVLVSIFGSYARKTSVIGFLLPDKGTVKIITDQDGKVIRSDVFEGKVVKKGDVLFVINSGKQGESGGVYNNLISANKSQKQEIIKQIEIIEATKEKKSIRLKNEIKFKRNEISLVQREVKKLREKKSLAELRYDRNASLLAKGVVSNNVHEQDKSELINVDTEIVGRERIYNELNQELENLIGNLENFFPDQDVKISRLKQDIFEIEERISELEGLSEIVVRSPLSGTVTQSNVFVGSAVNKDKIMATIIPQNSKMEAHLFIPSKSAGFVRPNMSVRLRYDAFPYQKFGVYGAKIATISQISVTPKELEFEFESSDPLFLAKAVPDMLTISYKDEEIPLQFGSKFTADLVLERRKIYEWILGPLLFTGSTR